MAYHSKTIKTGSDAEAWVYGRKLYDGSEEPAVTLNLTKHSGDLDSYIFSGEVTLTPKAARKIAKHLLKAADAAESEA